MKSMSLIIKAKNLLFSFFLCIILSKQVLSSPQKTALIMAGYSSGAHRYQNNTAHAIKYYSDKGYKVVVVADYIKDSDVNWSSVEKLASPSRVEIVNVADPRLNKKEILSLMQSKIPERSKVDIFITGHGHPGDTDKLGSYISFLTDPKEVAHRVQTSLVNIDHQDIKDMIVQKQLTDVFITGVHCYSAVAKIPLDIKNVCAGSGVDDLNEHSSLVFSENSDLDRAHYAHTLFQNYNPAIDLDKDGKISRYEAHVNAASSDFSNHGMNQLSSSAFLQSRNPESFFSFKEFMDQIIASKTSSKTQIEQINQIKREFSLAESCSKVNNPKICSDRSIQSPDIFCSQSLFSKFFLSNKELLKLSKQKQLAYEKIFSDLVSNRTGFIQQLDEIKKIIEDREQLKIKLKPVSQLANDLFSSCATLGNPDYTSIGPEPTPELCQSYKKEFEIVRENFEVQRELSSFGDKISSSELYGYFPIMRLLNDLSMESKFIETNSRSSPQFQQYLNLTQCEAREM